MSRSGCKIYPSWIMIRWIHFSTYKEQLQKKGAQRFGRAIKLTDSDRFIADKLTKVTAEKFIYLPIYLYSKFWVSFLQATVKIEICQIIQRTSFAVVYYWTSFMWRKTRWLHTCGRARTFGRYSNLLVEVQVCKVTWWSFWKGHLF